MTYNLSTKHGNGSNGLIVSWEILVTDIEN